MPKAIAGHPRARSRCRSRQLFPYDFGGAGDINSDVEDMARWVRLQLGDGSFEGRRIVSPENLAFTRTPRVAMTDKLSYALGWVIHRRRTAPSSGTTAARPASASYVGLVPDKKFGVIVLTNETNVGFPDALGLWLIDRILGNPRSTTWRSSSRRRKTEIRSRGAGLARPANPRPFPPLAPLAGKFVNPSFGKAAVTTDGDALMMEIEATGAKLKLEPWDGDIFTARLMPPGRFPALVENLGPCGRLRPVPDGQGRQAQCASPLFRRRAGL